MHKLLASLPLLLLVGCTHHVRIDFPNTVPSPVRHAQWVNGWLWHLVGGETSIVAACGDRPVHRIDVKKSFGNRFVGWITFGIYTPMHVSVQCGERPMGFPPPPAFAPPPPPPGVYVQPPAVYMPPPR
jgi:hypothetical protein